MLSIKRFVPIVLATSAMLALSGCDQSGGAEAQTEAAPAAMTEQAAAPAETTAKPAATDRATKAVTGQPAARPQNRKVDPRLAISQPNLSPGNAATPTALTPSATTKPSGSADEAVLGVILEPTKLELGRIATNDAATGIVRLVNNGTIPRKVLDCKTSCGCTTANCQKGKTLQPGESMEVEVKLSGGPRATKLNKTVTFIVSEQAPLRLPVSAEAVAFVSVQPARLDPEQHPDGRLVFRAIDDTPFTIKSMYPPVLEEFSEIPAVEQVVFIPWDTLREQGHRSTKMLFTLDHPKSSRVSATLSPNALPAPQRSTTRPAGANQAVARQDIDRLLKDGNTEEIMKMIAEEQIAINGVDGNAQTPLIKAARWGNPEVVQALLDASADIAAGDRIGRTPLMYACQSKNVETVRVLLDSGADINSRDTLGNTALCWAAGFGDSASVKEIIDAGAEIEVVLPIMGFTPLIWASLSGEAGSIQSLLDAGANIEAADGLQGATPLMHAVRTGGPENVRVLLEAGANLEARNNDGKTPLLVGTSNAGADAAIIQLLLDAGADTSARDRAGENALERARARTDLRSREVIELLEQVIPQDGE